MAAAASELGALEENTRGAGAEQQDRQPRQQSWWAFGRRSMTAQDPAAAAAPTSAPVADARSLGVSGLPADALAELEAAAASSASSNKIINVRSLPRRLPTNGGSRFPGPSGVSSSASSGRFRVVGRAAGAMGGGPGRFAGGPGRFGAGSTGGAGGAGQARRRRTGRRRPGKTGGTGDEEGNKSGKPEQEEFTPREQAWLEAREVGEATAYEPSVTHASLVGYGPAVATSRTAGTLGPTATVLRAMRVLGGGQPFCDDQPNTSAARARLLAGQWAFFDSPAERAGVETALRSKRVAKRLETLEGVDSPLVPASAATRAAILETTVRGLYETPAVAGSTAHAAVFETLQRYRSKDYTWSAAAGRILEGKMRSLLPGGRPVEKRV